MVQYVVYLGLFPLALAGTILAICLPRIKHSYQRFRWLRAFNWTQLVFLLVNATELLTPDVGLKKVLASVDYLLLGGARRSGSCSAWNTRALSAIGDPGSSSFSSFRRSPWSWAWATAPTALSGGTCAFSGSAG